MHVEPPHRFGGLTADAASIRRFWEGIYVLYDYSAPRTASQQVQKYLSTPIAGNELNILRCASLSMFRSS